MPDPISAAAAALSAAYQAVVGAVAAPFVAALGEGAAIALASAVVNTAISATISVGLNAVARAQIPEPEAGKLARRQSRPQRAYMVGGPVRISGAYMLRETIGNKLGVVLALAEERSVGAPSAVYLNDDLVTVNGSGFVQGQENGRFGTGDLIQIKTRTGLPTETAYSELFETFGAYWNAAHRGDGLSSLMMLAQHRSKESFPKHFPNGEPIPSVVDAKVCYDWRDPTQSRENPATWKGSANPIVWLVFVRWHRLGMSWARCIAPNLAYLTAQANLCDVEQDGEPRYQVFGWYFADTEPDTYLQPLLASCDGWMTINGRGHLVIKAGQYEPPTFTLTGEHIEGYTWRAFQPDEEAVNELIVSYVSPAHNYSEIEADPWRDEADIAAVGPKTDGLSLKWVHSPTQARRLAKRKMSRLTAKRRGQIRTGIYGLNGLGQRYIRVQNPELASMADVVLEVMNIEMDILSAQVVFDVILADPDIDGWNPVTEGGVTPGLPGRPPPEISGQEPALRPISRTVDFPTSATDTTVSIVAHTAVLPNGDVISLPAATVTGATALTTYAVFWRADAGYVISASPATSHFSTGSWVFVGWQATSDAVGEYPAGDSPPGGWGGDGGTPRTETVTP